MPKYDVILRDLSAEIAEMEPGDQLPTERELSTRYAVSSMTVRRALQILIDAKRIIGVKGRGTFVSRPTLTREMSLTSFTRSMRLAGMTAHSDVVSAAIEPAGDSAANALGIDPTDKVYRIHRVRYGDSTPLCVDRTILRADRFPGLLGYDLTGSIYHIFENKYDVSLVEARSRISAVSPSSADAAALRIPVSTPCLQVITRGVSRDQTIESTHSVYRGDLYELAVSSIRNL